MPELPEVETTRRGLAPLIEGHRLTEVRIREHRLRWPVDLPASLPDQRLRSIERRAKYLLFTFETGTLLIHLGMSGSLRVVPEGAPYFKHDHVELVFDGVRSGSSGSSGSPRSSTSLPSFLSLRMHDPRRFGSIHWHEGDPEDHRLIAELGIEPMDPAFDGSYLKSRARARRVAVKNFIMDGRVVVGVGNIYANESLFLAGIRPTVAAGRISLAGYVELAGRIRHVLLAAIQAGGTTLRDFVNSDGNPGYFKQDLNVYDRAGLPCPACAEPLIGIRLGQRATVFCKKCQKAQGFTPPEC